MIGCIIQARMGSTRFPGKILEKIDGSNSALSFLIEQLKNVELLDKIIIATTNNKKDDIIVKFSKENNIEYFRGSEDDVLNRYYEAAKKFSLDVIVRVTSDNPLIDPKLIDQGIQFFNLKKLDVYTTNQTKSFPYGVVFEIFSFNALEKVEENAVTNSDKEHVTPFFYSNKQEFKIFDYENGKNMSHIRCSLDTTNDLVFIRELIKKIDERPIHLDSIILAITKFPELLNINNKN